LGNATTFGKNREVQMGMIAVLHTWGQQLSLHPHQLQAIPGSSVNKDGAMENIRADGKFLFSVKVSY
jgi:hypothetical protein